MGKLVFSIIVIFSVFGLLSGNFNAGGNICALSDFGSSAFMEKMADNHVVSYNLGDGTYEDNGITFRTYEASDGAGEYESSAKWVLPVPNGDKALEKILHQLLGDEIDINDIQGYLDKAYAPGEGAATLLTADEEEEINISTVWNIEPVLVLDKYLVMEVVDGYMDQYMAHYEIMQNCIVFDRTTGEVMTRDDMFDEGADLYKVARKFRESANDDLDEFDESNFEDPDGFLFEEVFTRGSFYFTNDSLFFVYGPYEINYAYGFDVKMGVSKEWIKPYMNKENYLYKYWFGKK